MLSEHKKNCNVATYLFVVLYIIWRISYDIENVFIDERTHICQKAISSSQVVFSLCTDRSLTLVKVIMRELTGRLCNRKPEGRSNTTQALGTCPGRLFEWKSDSNVNPMWTAN